MGTSSSPILPEHLTITDRVEIANVVPSAMEEGVADEITSSASPLLPETNPSVEVDSAKKDSPPCEAEEGVRHDIPSIALCNNSKDEDVVAETPANCRQEEAAELQEAEREPQSSVHNPQKREEKHPETAVAQAATHIREREDSEQNESLHQVAEADVAEAGQASADVAKTLKEGTLQEKSDVQLGVSEPNNNNNNEMHKDIASEFVSQEHQGSQFEICSEKDVPKNSKSEMEREAAEAEAREREHSSQEVAQVAAAGAAAAPAARLGTLPDIPARDVDADVTQAKTDAFKWAATILKVDQIDSNGASNSISDGSIIAPHLPTSSGASRAAVAASDESATGGSKAKGSVDILGTEPAAPQTMATAAPAAPAAPAAESEIAAASEKKSGPAGQTSKAEQTQGSKDEEAASIVSAPKKVVLQPNKATQAKKKEESERRNSGMKLPRPKEDSFRKLSYCRCGVVDDMLDEVETWKDGLPYEEVDISDNGVSNYALRGIATLCGKCPKLRVLKLFKNNFGDDGVHHLERILDKCQTLREVHLSHNRFSESGIRKLVEVATDLWQKSKEPLWLRVENNHGLKGRQAQLLVDLEKHFRVCWRRPACRQFYCSIGSKVHLPFLDTSRERKDKELHELGLLQLENNRSNRRSASWSPSESRSRSRSRSTSRYRYQARGARQASAERGPLLSTPYYANDPPPQWTASGGCSSSSTAYPHAHAAHTSGWDHVGSYLGYSAHYPEWNAQSHHYYQPPPHCDALLHGRNQNQIGGVSLQAQKLRNCKQNVRHCSSVGAPMQAASRYERDHWQAPPAEGQPLGEAKAQTLPAKKEQQEEDDVERNQARFESLLEADQNRGRDRDRHRDHDHDRDHNRDRDRDRDRDREKNKRNKGNIDNHAETNGKGSTRHELRLTSAREVTPLGRQPSRLRNESRRVRKRAKTTPPSSQASPQRVKKPRKDMEKEKEKERDKKDKKDKRKTRKGKHTTVKEEQESEEAAKGESSKQPCPCSEGDQLQARLARLLSTLD